MSVSLVYSLTFRIYYNHICLDITVYIILFWIFVWCNYVQNVSIQLTAGDTGLGRLRCSHTSLGHCWSDILVYICFLQARKPFERPWSLWIYVFFTMYSTYIVLSNFVVQEYSIIVDQMIILDNFSNHWMSSRCPNCSQKIVLFLLCCDP